MTIEIQMLKCQTYSVLSFGLWGLEFSNVARGLSLVLHDPEGSHYKNLMGLINQATTKMPFSVFARLAKPAEAIPRDCHASLAMTPGEGPRMTLLFCLCEADFSQPKQSRGGVWDCHAGELLYIGCGGIWCRC